MTGKIIDRLSRLATDTNARPFTGSEPYTAAWDLAYAVPKTASIPITSPVERISGPSTVSTPFPLGSRNRPNGSTASFTAIGASSGSPPPSPSAWSTPCARRSAMVLPSMIRAAALASGTAVAFETNGTVRDARGFASRTYSTPAASAYCTFSRPRTPTLLAMASVAARICAMSPRPTVIGGSAQAESPEWMPASSMCSITPPRYSSDPSYSASTSISIASSRNLSISTGWPGLTCVALDTYDRSVTSS